MSEEKEVDRRRRVAEEKIWGATIELVERLRKKPTARSIALRIITIYQPILDFQKTVKMMGKSVNPLKTLVPSYTKDQTNFLIKTYNSLIEDLQHNVGKKDSYVKSFFIFEELDDPTINEVVKIFFMMATNLSQILCYMIRWT